MPAPLPNQGNGADQFKAQILQWIRDEIRKAAQGGANGSLHLDGATGNLVVDKGDIRSGNYVAGTSGWDLKPTGDQELHGNTVIGGSSTINGTLTVGANTTIGGTLGVTGNTTLGAPTTVSGSLDVTGPMTVGGTLSLPSGIIGNDSLTSPIVTGSVGSSQSNFALLTTGGAYALTSITVPTGYSQAIVMCVVDASTYNGGTGGSYVYLSANINGVTGGENSTWVPAGVEIGQAASGIRTLTGLGGGAFPVSVHLRSGSNIAAQAATIANLNAIAIFLR